MANAPIPQDTLDYINNSGTHGTMRQRLLAQAQAAANAAAGVTATRQDPTTGIVLPNAMIPDNYGATLRELARARTQRMMRNTNGQSGSVLGVV